MYLLKFIIFPVGKIVLIYLLYKLLEVLIRFGRLAFHYLRFPSEPSHWLLGDLIKVAPNFPFRIDRNEIAVNIKEWAYRYHLDTDKRHDVSILWMSWIPIVICASHKSLQPIITKPETKKHHVYKYLGLKDGLITSNGAKWKGRRKMLEPMFTSKQLSQFAPIMWSNSNKIVDSLENKCYQPINMSDYIHTFTIDSIFEAAFKVPSTSFQPLKKHTVETIELFEDSLMVRICNPFFWHDWLFSLSSLGQKLNEAHNKGIAQFGNLLNARQAESFGNNNNKDFVTDKSYRDMIDLMFKHKDHIDQEGMIEEIITMIAAGHETIANSLRWLIFILGNNPDIQDRVVQEIHDVIGDLDGSDIDLDNLSVLNQLVYMEQCIKESLRLIPPLPVVLRHLESDTQVGSKVLLKDSVVVMFILAVHHDPTVYPDSFRYNPGRFAPDKIDSIPKYAFLPFGLGPRMCMGYRYAMLEMKIFLSQFLRRYRVKSVKTMEEVSYYIELISRPSCPLEVVLSPRV